jgi:hypothetical protein
MYKVISVVGSSSPLVLTHNSPCKGGLPYCLVYGRCYCTTLLAPCSFPRLLTMICSYILFIYLFIILLSSPTCPNCKLFEDGDAASFVHQFTRHQIWCLAYGRYSKKVEGINELYNKTLTTVASTICSENK